MVVGGAGHIGYACCEALADLGASVAIADVDRDRAEALAAQLAERTTGEVAGLRCDVTEESFDELRENVLTAFGGLDVLVYSAGMTGATRSTGWGGPFEDQGAAAWRLANEINVHGFFRLVQALVEDLRQSQGASVIAVSSIYATNGQRPDLYFGTEMSNPAAYGASKAALSQVVRWLSSTLAPAIRVNAVSPGGIARGQDPAFQERYTQLGPLARMGFEEDIKGVVSLLAGDASSYITGVDIPIDGGYSAV